MARIEWDKTGDKWIESGVSKGVLYPLINGKYTTGVPWNGLTGVTEQPEGAEANDLYADNIKYASLRSAEKFGATVEAYTYPEEFAMCDGSANLDDDIKGVYVGQQVRVPFGMSYRTELSNDTNEEHYKIHLVYNCTAAPSEKAYETTNDSPDGVTFSWDLDSTPVNVPGGKKPTSLITIDSSKVDGEILKKIEDKLYGSETEEATLPTPEELLALMKSA